ncbi:hypothetical protein STAS_01566 [Striga asiatica]|uniref:Uncharacterized protein n=1 Tax=Striga asiatica TaxID=4170 RepID=A0A5A7NZK6_STRAF|nr:hypothetical protein STAS_01566 [Striga asiatica]
MQQQQPPRSSFSCDRHPAEQFTGFCPSCLCERLTTLDQSSSNTPSSSRRPSSASAAAAAAIRSLFSSNPKPPAPPQPPPPAAAAPKPSKPSFFPELRRTKSFSASKNEALGPSFEPQRKSCDVRARSTLSSLFTIDDGSKTAAGNCNQSSTKPSSIPAPSIASTSHQNPQIPKPSVAHKPVFEETANQENFKDPVYFQDPILVCDDDSDDDGDEIKPVRDTHLENLRNSFEKEPNSNNTIEEEEEVEDLKPMKDHIDIINTHEKKTSGFWAAASVFSKKWRHKWRRKQKSKKPLINGTNFATLPVEKPISRQYRETQSEIADYGFGRRSCDVAPRFSLDAARASLDDPRYSFDEPRASWDGHLIIGRSFPRMHPMVSVMEDTSPAGARQVPRSDMQIPVEGNSVNCANEGESVVVPGGSMQTREYYLDSSSSRRRKSLDRSSSMRKSVVLGSEPDELRLISTDCFHGAKVMVEGENNNDSTNNLRDSSVNSQSFSRGDDCCSETFELGSGVFGGESGNSFVGSEEKKESKKSRRWSWRIWGLSFINRRSNNNNSSKDEKYGRTNGGGVERSFSESWHGLGGENGDLRSRSSRNIFRSNSSVSWRNGNHNHNQIDGSGHGLGLFGSMRKSEQANGKKKRDEFVLEKNRSARYSANDVVDNGLLRFYLTPMRNSRKGGFKPNNSHSIARSVLRLY